MTEWIWISVFIGSIILLGIAAIKSKMTRNWVRWVFVNMAVAALMLYVINVIGVVDGLRIPINTFTMVVAALLGLPGVLVLIAIAAWIV